MTLAGGGDWPAAERHLERLRGEVPPSGQGIIPEVVLPLSEGLHAFAAGDWQRTIEHIEPIRGRLIALGGSRTQRDVFHDTLLEASFRAGDADRAERLLARAPRPPGGPLLGQSQAGDCLGRGLYSPRLTPQAHSAARQMCRAACSPL